MDTARYILSLVTILSMPGVYLLWFSIHPFVRFWRKVGPWRTLAIHYSMLILLGVGIFIIRKPLLSIEFGTNYVLIAIAVPIYVVAIVLRKRVSRRLSLKVLTGLSELEPEKYQSRLITEGIYSRIRHPRYVQILLALLACALFCNYLAVYVVVLAGVVWVLLLVRVEEKELLERFGPEYADYCARVPRFVPRF